LLRIINGLKNGSHEVNRKLDKTKKMQHGLRTELDVEVNRFGGVVGRYRQAEEIMTHMVEKYEAVLVDELDREGLNEAHRFGIYTYFSSIGIDVHEWFYVIF